MISPAVRDAISLISPLLDRNLALALADRWDLAMGHAGAGRLEDLVIHYGLVRGSADPELRRKGLYVFCADHGIAQEGVSREAPGSTVLRMRHLSSGGSASGVMCRHAGVEPVLVNVGVRGPEQPGSLHCKIGDGSLNSTRGPALTVEQANAALELGLRCATDAARRFDVVAVGQIGVGCSASASAVLSAFIGRDASETVIRGSGPDDGVVDRRIQAVRMACNRNQQECISPFGILRCLGGLDLAAIAGFLLGAASLRLPVILDGFNSGAAALVARAMAPDSPDAMIFSHVSPENAHALMLRFLAVEPLLELQILQGAGFAAALAIQMLETGLHLYREVRPLPAD